MKQIGLFLASISVVFSISAVIINLKNRSKDRGYKLVIMNDLGPYEVKQESRDLESLKKLGEAICKTSGPNCKSVLVKE